MADAVGALAAASQSRRGSHLSRPHLSQLLRRGQTKLFIAIERALARFCTDRIVVISEQQRDEICRKFKVGRFEQFRLFRWELISAR